MSQVVRSLEAVCLGVLAAGETGYELWALGEPPPPEMIFADGFESGDNSAWGGNPRSRPDLAERLDSVNITVQ